MRPVEVTIDVPYAREEVYDFLDVMANHAPFTDHMLHDWKYSGPARGIGSKATVKASAGGRTDAIEIEVVEAHRPTKIVEQNVGAGGRRIANGTYTFATLPSGSTRIAFAYAWRQAPLSERLASPLVRALLRRKNARSMRRLAEQLAARRGAEVRA
jgi:carbon monoxide dehydrogenase subunit G